MSNTFIEAKQLKSLSIELSKLPKQIPGATASALNRTLDFTATRIVKEVTSKYAIKVQEVRKTLKKNKASKSKLYAYVQSKGNTIALSRFPHNPKKATKKGKGIKVKVMKSSGYKTINTSPKAFVQTMKNAPNIWKRKGDKRFPVVLLRTLSVPQMISDEATIKKIQEAASKKLEERTAHEIKWRLEKAASKKGG